MSRAVGRRLALAAVLLLALPLAASARPIETPLAATLSYEQVWSRILGWLGSVAPKAIWGEQGTDINPNGLPVSAESDAGTDIYPNGLPASAGREVGTDMSPDGTLAPRP
ncbi:MAG TPA: hypothetical protein VGS22_02730 [Thermoanaerobaculia bacterium]|jgi:hypothetical protein|nr:hypothetical protein [Thermoanaerobaculia bacterium]